MVREIVTIQVGQCGNQIGRCFWDLALKEHASVTRDGRFDDAMSSYFCNLDPSTHRSLGTNSQIHSLKARAVLVDTEEGVLRHLMSSPLAELFDDTAFIKGVSGAGNNFAHGFFGYGAEYGSRVVELAQHALEKCDSPQAFFLLHSTGGGTGSGLGSHIIKLMHEEFPEILRFAASVFPAPDDDVVTSPYNAAFAVEQLLEHADCVFPMDNQALLDICQAVSSKDDKGSVAGQEGNLRLRTRTGVVKKEAAKKDQVPFDDMNSVAGHMLSNLTSCARFHGKMNVDLSELITNLVPFPKMQFILSGLSPLYMPRDKASAALGPKQIDQVFSSVLSRQNQLLKSDPINGQFYSCAMMVRGNVNITDVNRNIERISSQIDLVEWNQEGFKVGHASVPPAGLPVSLLCLSNNTSIRKVFQDMETRFRSLYGPRRKAFVHHYTQYCDPECFDHVLETLRQLQEDYSPSMHGAAENADQRIRILA